MIYTALLRGINVGGKTKVEMPRLRMALEDIGCKNVSTYINSGNVVFSDSRAESVLLLEIEKVLSDEFALELRIVLRNLANITKLCEQIPPEWTNDTVQKTDVIFLRPEISDPNILDKVVHNHAIENVLYIDGALVWNIGRENVTRGNGIKLIKTELYKNMTVRNINTVRKLKTIMEDLRERTDERRSV